jgi:NADPH:quinone reductase-like Zn-dependent oxidoreductase
MAASHEQRRTIQDLREARPGACSIDREFGPLDTVLVTGATGYIGSLVAEALLRTTAARVVVLVRSRAGLAPADRLAKLKNGPVFRLLREEQPARLTGFEAVEVSRHPRRKA